MQISLVYAARTLKISSLKGVKQLRIILDVVHPVGKGEYKIHRFGLQTSIVELALLYHSGWVRSIPVGATLDLHKATLTLVVQFVVASGLDQLVYEFELEHRLQFTFNQDSGCIIILE